MPMTTKGRVMNTKVLAVFAAIGLGWTGWATTYYVQTAALGGVDAGNEIGDASHPFLTISNAVQHAEDSDVIVVGDGTFDVSAEIVIEKGITVRSANGAGKTLVKNVNQSADEDDGIHRIFFINHPQARVEGFTIANGWGKWTYASRYDKVKGARGRGLGVRIHADGGTLSDCVITNCTMVEVCIGSAFALESASGVISNCVVRKNSCAGEGGCGSIGYLNGGLLTHCKFEDNVNGANYGGIYSAGGNITRCVFAGNAMTAWGAQGACVYHGSGTLAVEDTLFKDNVSKAGQSTVYLGNDTAFFTNCTFVGNVGNRKAGAAEIASGKKPVFYGCLFANNLSGASSSDAGFPEVNPGAASFVNCYSTTPLPAAQSPGSASGTVTFAADGYTPVAESEFLDVCPASDYGDLGQRLDVNGVPRLSGDAIDVGAAEFQYPDVVIAIVLPPRRPLEDVASAYEARVVVAGATQIEYQWATDEGYESSYTSAKTANLVFATPGDHTVTLRVKADGVYRDAASKPVTVGAKDLYVVPDADGHHPVAPYASWTTAATNIAQALAYAADGSRMTVTNGTYAAAKQTKVDCGVHIASVNGPEATVLKIIANPVLTNDGDVPRVLEIDCATAVVEGFTIRDGQNNRKDASALSDRDFGGGVRISSAGGRLVNCIVRDNKSAYSNGSAGAGLAVLSSDGIVSNCTILANGVGNNSGGGVIMNAGLVTHCRFERNSAYGGYKAGGGAYLSGGRITHCVFVGNSMPSGDGGGGAYVRNDALVDNCLFVENAGNRGGGVSLGSNGQVLNCTFVGNASNNGGVYTVDTGVVRNCIVAGNTNTTSHGMSEFAGTAGRVTYTLSPDETYASAAGNIVGAPVFKAGTYVPTRDSPGVDRGTTADYESYLLGGTDLAGRPRTTGSGRIDLGAYQANHNGLSLIVR